MTNKSRKHGTFRPTLKALVQQNDAKAVEQISRKGFASFRFGDLKAAITNLTKLRGIGPATASLMLSVLHPERAPFFSDELFRWAFFEPRKGNGWDRPIKYTEKEYKMLYQKVNELRERMGASAVDAEKVAFVLGKGDLSRMPAKEDAAKHSKHEANEDAHEEKRPERIGVTKTKRALPNDRLLTKDKAGSANKTTRVDTADSNSVRRSKRQRRK